MSVYNGGQYLAEALASAVAQTYAPLEIVIYDNASTDNTEAVVRRFADPRIRYLRNPTNIGVIPNFRRVLGEACGTYFT
jgi:glycosyltransferase involved in cell wall biosynthesis